MSDECGVAGPPRQGTGLVQTLPLHPEDCPHAPTEHLQNFDEKHEVIIRHPYVGLHVLQYPCQPQAKVHDYGAIVIGNVAQ